MDIINVNAYLKSDVLLYPMQGFYLLHMPLINKFSSFDKTLLGEKHLIIVGQTALLIFQTHEQLIHLLKEHKAMGSETYLSRLGVLTSTEIESALIEAISFTEYGEMNELDALQSKQRQAIYSILEEENYDIKV